MLDSITPLVLTYNEAPNIARTMARLAWASRIVVVDSGSTDETINILHKVPSVQVIHRPFTDFASQCNFGLTHVKTPWVLSLDADYELSDQFVVELRNLTPTEITAGYRARFVYKVWGHSLRGTLYPPRTVLYRKDRAHYQNEGHGHRVTIDGAVMEMSGVIYHDDRKPLARWLASQQRYVREEVSYLFERPRDKLAKIDKIRLMGWPAPLLILLYTLFAKGCLLDGWAGWYYALQRLYFEVLTALEIVDRRLRSKADAGNWSENGRETTDK